ncbi:MAG: hypothetical protein IPL41_06715 [Micropruina sp.]|nr:hypothetical protein [Micropruina sp.]
MTGSSAPVEQPTWVPTALLALALVASLLSGYLLTGRSVDHYTLPAPDGGTQAMTHTYVERVWLAGLAWATAAGSAVALALKLRGRTIARWAWIALGVALLIVLNAAILISALPQPAY